MLEIHQAHIQQTCYTSSVLRATANTNLISRANCDSNISYNPRTPVSKGFILCVCVYIYLEDGKSKQRDVMQH